MKGKDLFVIVATAIVCITLCSLCSPIYPFNDWVDSNCFMTVGKSMLSGVIPYRDLMEQKGPLLYMLHALAALISYRTFIGVYFIELIAAFGFLYYSLKIMRLYNPTISNLFIPIIGMLVYSAHTFVKGDSAEELALPIYAYTLYVGFKAILENKRLSSLSCILVGALAACILWIKFSILGLYIGWFIYLAYRSYKRNDTTDIWRMIGLVAIGVAILTIPVIAYFAVYGAVGDLFEVYFYNNLFYYTSERSIPFMGCLKGLHNGFRCCVQNNPLVTLLLLLGFCRFVAKSEKQQLAYFGLGIVTTYLLAFVGGQFHKYYALILSAFLPISVAALYNPALWEQVNIPKFVYKRRYVCVFLCCIAYLCLISDNKGYVKYKKSDLPQYQFAEIINQKPNATLLNYGALDLGFYTTTGIIPHCKYFCKIHIPLEEMMQVQYEYVENGWTDFIVTIGTLYDFPNYKLVKQSKIEKKGGMPTYYLYQLIEPQK